MKKLSGQITIEASIVIPIVMMVVASLMYLSFYIHDIVAMKSYTYSTGNRNIEKEFSEFEKEVSSKIARMPLLVMCSKEKCIDYGNSYKIEITMSAEQKIKWINKLLKVDNSGHSVKVEKNMDCEMMYAVRAVCDVFRDKRE